MPGLLASNVALRTLSEAITITATRALDIDRAELQAEYRPALTEGGHEGLEAEIYLYDTLAGGAGFARRVGELGSAVFVAAIRLLEECPTRCDRSCYRCLRNFGNRFEHDLLDRHLGASLLRYLIRLEEPALDEGRARQAADLLCGDLKRQAPGGTEFWRDTVIEIPGLGQVTAPILARRSDQQLIIGIHGPLTPGHTDDAVLRAAQQRGAPVFLADEMVISRNLPRASAAVIDKLR